VITSVSPNSGAAGTQVTITGSNFGSTQGSSTVTLNGATVTPASWSVTRIVGLVPTGATTGSVVVTVGGVASNGLNFTVITYPVISSVSPNSGVAGTQVTIAGSGFGATQGSGSVWLGTAPGQVVSWSDGQVMTTVASGSNSGSAQILQNGFWSNSMPFTISNPRITSITPDRGFPGTVVTIQGTGFGSSQESGIAWIGGTNASASSWNETQVSATVAASAVSGIVKIQQNGVWSNAVTFTVPSASVTLSPNVLSMVVGDTRSLQALNANYQPVPGLTWTSSDTTILTLSAGDPPVLTAVAPGNVTVFAGDASADVTVYPGALPVGTVLWSIPGNGSRVSGIYPAVPSSSGVADVFATEDDGTVLAVTADGEVAWTTNVGTDFWNFLPDFQGGLVVYNINNSTFYKLDGLTGQAYPAYQPSPVAWGHIGPPAIHTDGTIFTSDYTCTNADCSNSAGWLVGIDPSSGTSKFRAPTANSTGHVTSTSNDFDAFGNPWCGPLGSQTSIAAPLLTDPMVLGDGYAYTTYVTYDGSQTTSEAVQPFPVAAYDYFERLRVDTNYSRFADALRDLAALEQLTGTTFDPLVLALQNGDLAAATAYETYDMAGLRFNHLCDVSNTTAVRLHIFRVGSDGSSSDMVIREWNYTDSKVYAPTPGNLYDFTRVQSAPQPWNVGGLPMIITNADTGALVS